MVVHQNLHPNRKDGSRRALVAVMQAVQVVGVTDLARLFSLPVAGLWMSRLQSDLGEIILV